MPVSVSIKSGIAEVLLDDAARMNALEKADYEEIHRILSRLAVEQTIRGLIVRGAGTAFCAGASLDGLDQVRAMNDIDRKEELRSGSNMIKLLIRFPAPTVAVVDGACFGIGTSLALACDRVIATPRAKFGFVFTRIGIPGGDMAASWLVSRRIGSRAAWNVFSEALVLSGQQALDLGLVDSVADGTSLEIAAGLPWSVSAPLALRVTKRQILEIEGAFSPLEAQMETQLDELTAAVGGLEMTEGIASLREKRPANFA